MMRKKVWCFAIAGLIMITGIKATWASNMNEDFQSCFIAGSNVENEDNKYADNNVFSDGNAIYDNYPEILDEQIPAGLSDNSQDYLETNTYYDILSLNKRDASADNGTVYYLYRVNVPKDGRVRVVIEDCNTDAFPYVSCINENTETGWKYSSYDWWDVGIDSYDSGWITVKSGEVSGHVAHLNWWGDSVNREAKLIIKYESQDEYIGECESNNTFDNANLMQHNMVYEGNIRSGDVDYYKFQMESPGLVNITGQDLCNGSKQNMEFHIYEEDEYENVYEITKAKNKKRLRLGTGNYFIKVKDTMEYSLSVDVVYESADEYEQERNNVKSYANEKKLDTWYTGNFNTNEDIDFYKFTLDQEEDLTLQFKVPRQTRADSVWVTLYDANLKELCKLSNTENPYAETNEKKYPAGIYYVQVQGWRDFEEDYSICLKKREKVLVKKITLPVYMELYVNETDILDPIIYPQNAENQKIIWSSSDNKIVSVNSNGKISAKSSGTAVITAKAADGSGVEANITVDVSDNTNILDMSFSKVGNKEYTGRVLKPTVKVKNGTETLIENVDYKISYKNNKNIGTASIIIQGIGNYKGTKTIKFNITPKKTTILSVTQAGDGKLTISWKKSSYAQGYVIYRSTSKEGTYSKIKTIANASTVKYTNSGLKSGTKYYYKIRSYKKVNGTNIYSDYSTAKYNTTKKSAVKFNGTYRGSNAEISVYQSNGKYYAKAYGRGGKMNTTVTLYKNYDGYIAYYSDGEIFFEISDISSNRIYVDFPLIEEFSGWYIK